MIWSTVDWTVTAEERSNVQYKYLQSCDTSIGCDLLGGSDCSEQGSDWVSTTYKSGVRSIIGDRISTE